tara:strand:- start:13573 stop:15435 length:1863 start_codon:yes stop_codon:yes gene_type:complete
MAELDRDIRYIDRNFNTIKNSLVDYTKAYFPNTYNDFTPESTGMLFMEMTSYVGDVLSFYLDNQIQETFIQFARQTDNLFNIAYMLGYTPKVTTVASVDVDLYQTVPAKLVGNENVPDMDYCVTLPENTTVNSPTNAGLTFLIEDVCDFSVSSSMDPTMTTIYEVAGDQPTSFLLKKTRKAISATIRTINFTFARAEKFKTVEIIGNNIIGILDCFDTNDNEWHEVPNLAQSVIMDTIRNTNPNDPNYSDDLDASYLLRTKEIQRRFVSRFTAENTLQLQFGAGSTGLTTEEIIPNPDNVGLGLPFEKTKLTTAFSPTNFVFTDTYGLAPYNTTLTVRYLTGGGIISNVEAGTLTQVNDNGIKFNNPNLANTSLANTSYQSIAANNVLAADGGQDGDTIEELRQNALGNFQNQLRTVTKEDYMIRALSMPANLGVIAKAYSQPAKISQYQPGELPTILDLYVLSYDNQKKLRTASQALKRNLQTYLSQYRMINDAIKIKDAFVVNIGIEFEIIVLPNSNNNEVLTKCIDALTAYFHTDKWQINQPIIIKELFVLLDKIVGVQTVQDVRIINKAGSVMGYSDYAYDVYGATYKRVVYPSIDPMVFELKFPNTDIKGRVVPL